MRYRCTNIQVDGILIGTDGEVDFRGGEMSVTQGTNGVGYNISTKQGGDLYLDSVPTTPIPQVFTLEFQYEGKTHSSKKGVYDRLRGHIAFI